MHGISGAESEAQERIRKAANLRKVADEPLLQLLVPSNSRGLGNTYLLCTGPTVVGSVRRVLVMKSCRYNRTCVEASLKEDKRCQVLKDQREIPSGSKATALIESRQNQRTSC